MGLSELWTRRRDQLQPGARQEFPVGLGALRRTSIDRIPPENFPRIQLDRPITDVELFYIKAFGPDKTPVQTAAEIIRRKGSVDLLDVGYGTGNMLWTWALAAAAAADFSIDAVRASGISLSDYSAESLNPDTLRAHQEGKINNMIGTAALMCDVPDNSMDVVLANASLIHTTQPEVWLEEMLRVARPGGTLFFDLSEEQTASDTRVMTYLLEKRMIGYVFEHASFVMRGDDGSQLRRTFCRLEKPSIS